MSGREPRSPALQVDSLPTELSGKPNTNLELGGECSNGFLSDQSVPTNIFETCPSTTRPRLQRWEIGSHSIFYLDSQRKSRQEQRAIVTPSKQTREHSVSPEPRTPLHVQTADSCAVPKYQGSLDASDVKAKVFVA